MTGVLPIMPSPADPPGRKAMPWTAKLPAAARASGASSSDPTPVRPTISTRSAWGFVTASITPPRVDGPSVIEDMMPPSRSIRACSSGPFASWAGSAGGFGPAMISATRGWPTTWTLRTPSPASMPRSCAPRMRPGSSRSVPAAAHSARASTPAPWARASNTSRPLSLRLDRPERQDRVGAFRQGPSRHNQGYSRGRQPVAGRDDRERQGIVIAGTRRLRCANRIAVLARLVGRREVEGRVDRKRKNTAQPASGFDLAVRQAGPMGVDPARRIIKRGAVREPAQPHVAGTSWRVGSRSSRARHAMASCGRRGPWSMCGP